MDEEGTHRGSTEGQENPEIQGVVRGAVKGHGDLRMRDRREVSVTKRGMTLVGDATGSR